MVRVFLLLSVAFSAIAGGMQKTATVAELPQAVTELLAHKDTAKHKKQVTIRTADGRKLRGHFVRFAGDILVLHDRPSDGKSGAITKLISIRQIKTVEIRRERSKYLAVAGAVTAGVYLAVIVPGSLATLAAVTPPVLVVSIALGVVQSKPSYHKIAVQ